MAPWILYCSDDNEKKLIPKTDKSTIDSKFKVVENICPLTGKSFKKRGEFWTYIKSSNLDPTNMDYDRIDNNVSDNVDKLLCIEDQEWLMDNYFEGKCKKKALEDLIGRINLELYKSLLKKLRETNKPKLKEIIKVQPTQEVSTQDESTQEISTQGVSVQEESEQEVSTQAESTQAESTQEESEQVESTHEESEQAESTQEESEQEESEQAESTHEESEQAESTQEESEQAESTQEESTNEDKMKYIDLFCGIGGFHQALDKLNCECVLACDIDKACRINYELNYGIEPHPDVKKINPNEIESNVDIICGGFPCQAFSNAGKKKMFNDDRGLLFDEIIRLANVKNPKFMFLENVKHILKVGDKKVIEYIKKKLDDNNYILQLFEISPHHYGVPQQRDRVYFVCVRKDVYNGSKIELPPKVKDFKFEDFLENKEDIDQKYFISGDVSECLNAWEEMIKIFPPGEKISPVIMINEHYNNHTQEDFDNYAGWRKGYITANKPLIQKYKSQWDKWYEKHKVILQKREIYGKLEWQAGPIKENDSIFNYFIQIRQSGIRVKRAHHFPTLVAISQIPIYGKEKRYITPRECARLQSFPENFKIDELDKHSYKQFGNAVNVSNVHTVIKSTFDHYGI
jgi:DNA (cytosine-5)-methyltransferase 1